MKKTLIFLFAICLNSQVFSQTTNEFSRIHFYEGSGTSGMFTFKLTNNIEVKIGNREHIIIVTKNSEIGFIRDENSKPYYLKLESGHDYYFRLLRTTSTEQILEVSEKTFQFEEYYYKVKPPKVISQ